MFVGPIRLDPIRNPQLVRVLLEFRRLMIVAFGLTIGTSATLAELALVNGVMLDNGAHKWVRTLLRFYRLDKASVLAPDGITVIAAVGGGNWIAEPRADKIWLDQLAWYINPATGSDEANGALATPIKTWAEYLRRTGEDRYIANATVRVTLLGNLPISDKIRQNVRVGRDGLLVVQAAALLNAGPFTVLAYARNIAANNPGTLTANEVGFDPSLLVGKQIRFTTGVAAGATAWIKKDNGAGVAQITTPTTVPIDDSQVPAIVIPANLDTFIVVDLVQAWGEYLRVESEGNDNSPGNEAPRCVIDSIQIMNGNTFLNPFAVGGERFTMRQCKATDLLVVDSTILVQCDVGSTVGHKLDVRQGECFVYAGLLGIVSSDPIGVLFLGASPIGGQSIDLSGPCHIDADGLGIYDSVGLAITLEPGSMLITEGLIHGTGNGGTYGVQLQANTYLKYPTATVPTIMTGANALRVGAVPRSWTDVPYCDPHLNVLVTDGSNLGGSPTVYQTGLVGATTSNVTRYLAPNYTEQVADLSGYIIQNHCTLRKLRLHANTAASAAQTYTVTLVRTPAGGGGGPTAITAQLAGAAVFDASDLTHTVLCNPGDRISVQAVASATSAVADLLVSFEAS